MHRIRKIAFRLLAGGLISVVLPALVVGLVSMYKSSQTLISLAEKKVAGTAADLAIITDEILQEELKIAKLLAVDEMVVATARQMAQSGADGASDQVTQLYNSFKSKYRQLGNKYQGIFVADTNGILYTGVLESGKEYKGSNISKRGYFSIAKHKRQANVGNVVRSKSTKKLISVVCAPIISSDGTFLGAFGLVMKVAFLTDLVKEKSIGQTGYSFMTDKKGVMVAHPEESRILTHNVTAVEGMQDFAKALLSGSSGVGSYVSDKQGYVAGYAPVKTAQWFVGAGQQRQEALAAARSIRNLMIIIILVALGLAAGAIFYLARTITRPINEAVVGLKDIAQGEGDLTKRLAVAGKDEMGDLANWFNTFIDKLQQIITQLTGNSGHVDKSAADLQAIATQFAESSGDASSRSQNVSSAAEEMSANLNSVAAAMEEATANASMVAAAAEQMSATIHDVAKNAEEARTTSDQAVSQSKQAGETMSMLDHSAQQIGKVTETITEISEQTNLLALNATIEAARAGEAGKGFAVVANEIKELAKQTAVATQDIKAQIEEIQSATTSTVTAINEITHIISGANEIVSTIATAVEEQSVATKEIATNIAQASQGIGEVNQNVARSSEAAADITTDISQVHMSVDEICESSNQVKQYADELKQLAGGQSEMVGQFKV